MSTPEDLAKATAAFQAGYAAADQEQAAFPGTGEVPLDGGPPAQQPYVPPEPGGDSGVT